MNSKLIIDALRDASPSVREASTKAARECTAKAIAESEAFIRRLDEASERARKSRLVVGGMTEPVRKRITKRIVDAVKWITGGPYRNNP